MTEYDSLPKRAGWSVAGAARHPGYCEGDICRRKPGKESPQGAVMALLTAEAGRRFPGFTCIDLFAGGGGLRLPSCGMRRLTPREGARLLGQDGRVSDTRACRRFGYSVAVPALADPARAMLPPDLTVMAGTQKARRLG
ncbi:hypothetical protein [Pseudogemmobacter humi]|uniref:DNA cytosine methylase n=1 Tax=Pseudogemmobacter humi TaxID=2483812 RepID=A0A3P5XKP7_9RHOB|nr:hypothetical protein [Pseudogemmobacter humi]VDC32301.1 DNA cytosine methylase [Pseudogemmobacter humi]